MRKILLLSLVILALFIITCGKEEQDFSKYIPNGDQSKWVYNVTYNNEEPYVLTEKINGTEVINNIICQVFEETVSNDTSSLTKNYYTDNNRDTLNWYGSAHFINSVEDYRCSWDPVFLMFQYPFTVNKNWVPFNKKGMKPMEVPFLGPEMDSNDIDQDGEDDSVDMSIIATVETTEDVTVPAGTFAQAYKIRYDITIIFYLTRYPYPFTGQMTYYNWYKPEVGRVKGYVKLDLPDEWGKDFEQTEELVTYELH